MKDGHTHKQSRQGRVLSKMIQVLPMETSISFYQKLGLHYADAYCVCYIQNTFVKTFSMYASNSTIGSQAKGKCKISGSWRCDAMNCIICISLYSVCILVI